MLAALRVALTDSWSSANADGIRVAALEAVLSHPDGPRNHPELVVCVEIDTGQELLQSPGRSEDPSPALLRSIHSLRSMVRPQSECERTRDGVRHRPSGAAAVIIGVAAPRRSTDDFCRVEAFWFYDGLSSVGWLYTVSLDKGIWGVDTEKRLWIS